MIVLRSILFALAQLIITPPYAVLSMLCWPLPARTRYRVITFWSRIMVKLAGVLCGVRFRVEGLDNLPSGSAVVLCKHQSAWETLALQQILPMQVWVLKRQLLHIPFFGWGLAMLNPIAIDRGSPARALRQLLEQGKQRLAAGYWVVIFPEGTRVQPGERRRYHAGGAWLAQRAGVPVVPIAHNAGELWPRKAFLKQPGMITVSIGPAIQPDAGGAAELLALAEDWIEQDMQRITGSARSLD